MSRVGIRVQDLLDEKILRQKVEGALEQKNQLLVKVYNRRAVDADEVVDDLLSHVDRIRPLMANTGLLLGHALDDGRTVLLEGVRRRCWMLIMARIRSSPRPIRRRVAPARARAFRRLGSTG